MRKGSRDILERCIEFADVLIDFVEHELWRGVVPLKLLTQARDAGTSIGAHDAEAQSASTRRRRTSDRPEQLEWLCQEASELVAIHTTIVKKLRGY